MTSTVILSDNGASSGSAGLKQTAGNDGVLILQTTTSGGTATNAIYVDTSQNVGLGVTPSAWNTFKGLQIVGGSLVSYSNAYVDLFQNTYYDGSNLRYVNTGYASYYRQNGGAHSWNTAASGSAGGVATFTQSLAVGKGTTLALEGATSGAGTGITFPAVQNASSNAKTLDDYEEGSWTPRVYKNGVEITSPTSAFGRYIKIGQSVWVHVYFYKASGSSVSGGGWTVENLPFTAGTASYVVIPSGYNEINGTQSSGTLRWQPTPSGVQLVLYSGGAMLTTDWTTSFVELAATGVYQASA